MRHLFGQQLSAEVAVFRRRVGCVAYSGSFLNIRDSSIRAEIERRLDSGELWPKPLIQLNPAFEPGPLVDELVEKEILSAGQEL